MKEGMKLKVAKVLATSLKISDIVVYNQKNTIVAHRLICILPNKKNTILVTKGDNQPFGGVSEIEKFDLIGRAVEAFYENNAEKNLLVKNKLIDFFYVFMGKSYLFFKK